MIPTSGRPRPLVSVITPTRNQGRFIERTLASVAAQTYGPIEHIVIDGGSTDRTLAILEGWAGEGRSWISEPDRGMYDAINKGIARARGEILAYLNSDDALFPWAVEVAVEALTSRRRADIVYGDALRIDEVNGRQRLLLTAPFHLPTVAAIGSLVQPAVFWHRRVVDSQGLFDADLRYVGDLEYWLRAARRFRLRHVDEILAVERQHPGAFSQASRESMRHEGRRMREPYLPTAGWQRRLRLAEARLRDAFWRRWLLLRFAAAARRPAGRGPWPRFRAAGARVVTSRMLLGMLPRIGPPALEGAVDSSLAAATLGVGTTTPPDQASGTDDADR